MIINRSKSKIGNTVKSEKRQKKSESPIDEKTIENRTNLNDLEEVGQEDSNYQEHLQYVKQLSREYLKSRLGFDDTNESVSLVQPTLNNDAQNSTTYKFETNQSIHVRCAYYISWVKKVMLYQQMQQEHAMRLNNNQFSS